MGKKSVHNNEKKESKTSNNKKIVVFTLDSELYGVPVDDVLEVTNQLETTHIPNSPEFVIGFVNLRGKVITMIDLESRFTLERNTPKPRERKFVIVDYSENPFGVVVDDVREIKLIDFTSILPAPEVVNTKVGPEYIRGVYIEEKEEDVTTMTSLAGDTEAEKEAILILDLKGVFNTKEVEQK